MMSKNLTENLQIWGFEKDTVIFQDASYGFAFKCSTLDVSCHDDSEVNSLGSRIDGFLNALPTGVSVQFLSEIKPGHQGTLSDFEKRGAVTGNTLASELHQSRYNTLQVMSQNNQLPEYSLTVLVRRPGSHLRVATPSLFSKPKVFQDITHDQFEKDLIETDRLRKNIRSSLESLGLQVTEVPQREIVDLVYRQWNPDRPVALNEYDPDDLRDSILFTDMKVEPDGFRLGKMKHQVISIKSLPDASHVSMMTRLLELPFGSKLFLSVEVPNQGKEIEKLQRDRRVAFAMVHGKTGTSDIEAQAKLDDLDTLLEEMIAEGQKVFKASMNIVLSGQSEQELEQKVADCLMLLREMGGCEGMVETLAASHIFTELALPNARCKERARFIKTKNLSDLIPLFGPWEGTKNPSIILRNRFGSITKFDPFSSEFTNYNMVISGGSGSGKSFLTNLLLLQMLPDSPKIYIVDIGGSYKKLCDNLDGQYIPLALNSDLSINPFDLPEGQNVPSNQKIKFLVGLVELMTKENDADSLNRYQKAEVEHAIKILYEGMKAPRISDLRELLVSHEDQEIVRLGKILKTWCGDTPYGRFVDRETTVEFDKSLISFDLKGMESYPDLQGVCLFLITDLIWGQIQADRGTKKFVVFDECWKLLENDSGASFIAEVFRTFRKYYASAAAISQNMDDFAKSKVASAILSNSSIKWVLRQKGADQKRLAEVLRLNENESELVSSLTGERGHFSEAFLIAEDYRSVVAVEPFPLEYWVATSDPRDLAKLEEFEKTSGSKIEALKKAADEFPHGVVASESEGRS
jgi:conjugal transfer ATP-binding protein TraC